MHPFKGFITIAWIGVARRLLRNQVSPSSSTVAGWSNVIGGVALILSGIGIVAGGSLLGVSIILFGRAVEEGGRGYLRLCIDRSDDGS